MVQHERCQRGLRYSCKHESSSDGLASIRLSHSHGLVWLRSIVWRTWRAQQHLQLRTRETLERRRIEQWLPWFRGCRRQQQRLLVVGCQLELLIETLFDIGGCMGEIQSCGGGGGVTLAIEPLAIMMCGGGGAASAWVRWICCCREDQIARDGFEGTDICECQGRRTHESRIIVRCRCRCRW